MKMRRTSFSPIVLSLLVAITAALIGGGPPAVAQTTTTTTDTSTTSSTTTTSSAPVVTTTVVPLGGTVDGGPGQESVSISGNVQLTCTMVKDPDFKTPASMRHNIDLANVTGVGVKSGALYVVGGDVDIKIRPATGSDTIQITFPLFLSSAGMMTARQALATFTITTNGSGKVTGVTAVAGTSTF